MEELLPQSLDHPDNGNNGLQLKYDQLSDEMRAMSRKFTELSGAIVALEARNAVLQKNLSAAVLRNAVLSSENEELKQSVEIYVATQKILIRDLARALDIKWYRKLLRR